MLVARIRPSRVQCNIQQLEFEWRVERVLAGEESVAYCTRTHGVWTALHLRCAESLLQAHMHKHVEPLPAGLRAPACSFQIWYRYEVTLFVQSSFGVF